VKTFRYIARRLLQALPVLLGVLVINFLIISLAPGDIVDIMAGEAGTSSIEVQEMMREMYGLNQPLYMQFLNYLSSAVTLDLGFSFRQNLPVLDVILSRTVPTLTLLVAGTVFSVIIGVALGVLASRRVGSLLDNVISTLALIFYSIPIFWLSLMMIVLFTVYLRWFPSGGFEIPASRLTGIPRLLDIIHHVAMPGMALALFNVGIYTRLARASMIDTQTLDYVRTARAKGLTERRITIRHVLRNAILPVVTMTGLQVSALIGGSVVIETVFSYPGIGKLAYESITTRDTQLLLGILFVSTIMVIVCNLIVDLLYAWFDPRIELA
jgi:peptide/nickel transport system permease protein